MTDLEAAEWNRQLLAAKAMCRECDSGDAPEFHRALHGWVHIWKKGNGHSMCSAGPIWEKLTGAAVKELWRSGNQAETRQLTHAVPMGFVRQPCVLEENPDG
jgi:hypothetical protein